MNLASTSIECNMGIWIALSVQWLDRSWLHSRHFIAFSSFLMPQAALPPRIKQLGHEADRPLAIIECRGRDCEEVFHFPIRFVLEITKRTENFTFSLAFAYTDKTISVQWGTTTIMVSCRVRMFMPRRSKDGSDAASRITMHGLKLGIFCIASFCVLACFYVISHRVVGKGAVSCLVCMYGVRCFVRVAWARQVLPAACIPDTRLRPHVLSNRFARNPADCY